MKIAAKIILYISLLLCGGAAQAEAFIFRHLGADMGLSQPTVQSICQDGMGRMWFATRGGLNCYDGQTLKTYFPENKIPAEVDGSEFELIIKGHNGNIYMVGHNSFVEFDIRSERFREILTGNVLFISSGTQGIWVVKDNDIYLYDTTADSLSLYYRLTAKNIAINYALEASDGRLWLSTSKNGLYVIDAQKQISRMFPTYAIRSIYEDSKQNLWFGSVKDGLIRLTKENQVTYYKHDARNENSLTGDFVRMVCEDNDGNIWVGSPTGLSLIDAQTGRVRRFVNNKENPTSISYNSILSMYKDDQGTIWIGTYFGGVNYICPNTSNFKYYYQGPDCLPHSVVRRMEESADGMIWICTEGGGLCSLNPYNDKFSYFNTSNSTLSSNYLMELYYDRGRGCLWIGTNEGGLNRFDLSSKKITVIRVRDSENKNFMGDRITGICAYDNKILVSLLNSGVVAYNPESGELAPFFKEDILDNIYCRTIFVDSANRLWLGFQGGVVNYDLKTGKYYFFTNAAKGESALNVNVIYEDSKGRIWLGTSGSGLRLFDPATNSFKVVGASWGGSESYILSIGELPSGALIATTIGSVLNINPDTEQVSNEGLSCWYPLNWLNDRALLVSKKGSVYLGSVSGLATRDNFELNATAKSNRLFFNHLFVNTIEVTPHDESEILSSSLLFTKKIAFKSHHSIFSMSFASNDFINVGSRYQYRLTGYNDNWLDIKKGDLITYTNLSAGNYQLQVRESGNHNNIATIEIAIIPPFYLTNIAFIIYGIIALLLIVYFIRAYNSRLVLRTALEFEHKEKLQIEEMNQSKQRFFTNMSHEFRTPVTLILGQAQRLIEDKTASPSMFAKLKSIHRSADNLKSLINELLDFTKHEQGFMKLNISYVNINRFIMEYFVLFHEYALNKKVDFRISGLEQDVYLWIDAKQMQKVMNNLLSNAFKNTLEGGGIEIVLENSDNSIAISVADTGIGMAQEELNMIFDRFYCIESTSSKSEGMGIGLALCKNIVETHKGDISVKSQLHQGSTFRVVLRKGDAHFDESVSRTESLSEQSLPVIDTGIAQYIANLNSDNDTDMAKMLIVEDNDDVRLFLIEIFSPLYNIVSATNGLDGFELVRREQPDIVLSDIMMPGMLGTELCSRIKKSFDTCHIPVVLLTAISSSESALDGLRIGADDYIMKPFDVKSLVVRCNNIVNNRRLLHGKFKKESLFESDKIATNAIDEKLLEKAISVVKNNLEVVTFDVNEFAREMGLGRTNLFSKIKGITGLTPNDFIQNIRLKTAAEYLVSRPELNISDIGYQLGFSSPRYFNKCFKELFTVAPNVYRKQHRAENA